MGWVYAPPVADCLEVQVPASGSPGASDKTYLYTGFYAVPCLEGGRPQHMSVEGLEPAAVVDVDVVAVAAALVWVVADFPHSAISGRVDVACVCVVDTLVELPPLTGYRVHSVSEGATDPRIHYRAAEIHSTIAVQLLEPSSQL